ncbi:NAC domain containing protein 50 [Linum perenne]
MIPIFPPPFIKGLQRLVSISPRLRELISINRRLTHTLPIVSLLLSHKFGSQSVMEFGGNSELPVGCRFNPTDEELVNFYLRSKVRGKPLPMDFIPEYNLYGDKRPWELFPTSAGKGLDRVFAYTRVKKSGKQKQRFQRSVACGWEWHGNAKGMEIKDEMRNLIGIKKTFTFRKVAATANKRKRNTDDDGGSCSRNSDSDNGGGGGSWIMHEYSLVGTESDYVVCEIFCKGRTLIGGSLIADSPEAGVGAEAEAESHIHQITPPPPPVLLQLQPTLSTTAKTNDHEFGSAQKDDHATQSSEIRPEESSLPLVVVAAPPAPATEAAFCFDSTNMMISTTDHVPAVMDDGIGTYYEEFAVDDVGLFIRDEPMFYGEWSAMPPALEIGIQSWSQVSTVNGQLP